MAVHEGESLNAAEAPEFHILLDWSAQHTQCFGFVRDGKLTCNGYDFWERLREVLVKFITGLEAQQAFASGAGFFRVGITAPLGSIRPGQSTQVPLESD